MKICPKCNQQFDEGARFCPACGAQVVEHVTDAAWVAGIQEEIKESRGGRTACLWIMAGGLLFAAFPVFIEAFTLILAFLSDRPFPGTSSFECFTWSIPIGVAVAIGGIVGSFYYDNKIKKLRAKLTEGKLGEK